MKIDKKELTNIPNLISLIRLCSVPFFVFFILYGGLAKVESFIYIGLAIFLLSASSDLVDGYLARRYNQVTELGKFLDPFADKVMHIFVLLSLVIIGYVHWIFIVLIAIKEIMLIVFGIILINNKIVTQANMMGKIASFVISIGVLTAFFHPYLEVTIANFWLNIDWIVLSFGVLLTYMAFVNYGLDALTDLKRISREKKKNRDTGEGDE